MRIMPFRCTAIKYRLLLMGCLLAFFQACNTRQRTEYEVFRSLVPTGAPLDKDKHIALLLYNPQDCMSCNYILASLLDNPAYDSLFGPNSFVVFPSVRAAELKDYDNLLRSYGNVSVQYINDRKLFDLLKEKNKQLGARPKWVGLNIHSEESICFGIRETYLVDSIRQYFSLE